MFDPSTARARLDRLWGLKAHFAHERRSNRIFLDEVVSDRLQLLSGLQVLRDELQFVHTTPADADRDACGADFTHPSVVTTLAFTDCGDRIHQDAIDEYKQVVASRFATLSEVGALKSEAFSPAGGGTDDGGTLAHVTIAHQLDDVLRRKIYDGNPQSFVLAAFDLKTHVGRLDAETGVQFGKGQESPWREPRAACGAVVGSLFGFDEQNAVHRRIVRDLGKENWELLRDKGVRTTDGIDITAVVAAVIVAVQGMLNTAWALTREMDERGVAHLTASVIVNRASMSDTLLYMARATVFGGEVKTQGFGVDARKYSGSMAPHHGDPRLSLTYDGVPGNKLPIVTATYGVPPMPPPSDPFA